MFASPALPTVAASYFVGQTSMADPRKSPSARVGGLRRLGEILPLVMARLEEVVDAKPETACVANDLVIAVRLSPCEMPYSLVSETFRQKPGPCWWLSFSSVSCPMPI